MDGETEGLTEAETEADGLKLGLTLGETEADGLKLGLTDALGETLALGPISLMAIAIASASSSACVQPAATSTVPIISYL